MDTFESTVLKKYRRLSQFLVMSSLLNIAFISSAVYQYFKPLKPADWSVSKNPLTEDALSVLKNFLLLSYQDLLAKLSQKTLIEPGLYKRDLALAILHESYHIDLARALARPQISFQQLSYSDGSKQKWLRVPRALSDSEFDLIVQFLKQEAWPLTAQGLFSKLKFGVKDAALNQAFYRCSEFSHLFDALKLTLTSLKEETLLAMLLKGDLPDFELFNQCVNQGGFSIESFLAHYTALGSSVAAQFLVDRPQFSVKTLSDTKALELLDLLAAVPEKQKKIAQELFLSFRSDHFKQEIQKRGFESPLPQTLHVQTVPVATVEKKLPAAAIVKAKTYVVQEGDSLWKISRKFKVDIDALKKLNHLESENLKPGKVLTLP